MARKCEVTVIALLRRFLCAIGWHKIDWTQTSFDGASLHASCTRCKYAGMIDMSHTPDGYLLGAYFPLGGGEPVLAEWFEKDGVVEFHRDHKCIKPTSSDFHDGENAEGCWKFNGVHYQQIAGSSGVYLIETDIATGEVVRDDRPRQMTV